jgi:hypothetical protein
LAVVLERASGAPSFLRGLALPLLSLAWGGAYCRLVGVTAVDVRVALAVGTAALSLVFAACVVTGAQSAFVPVALAGGAAGVLAIRRTLLRRRIPWWGLVATLLVLGAALRVEHFVDRLPMDGSEPGTLHGSIRRSG